MVYTGFTVIGKRLNNTNAGAYYPLKTTTARWSKRQDDIWAVFVILPHCCTKQLKPKPIGLSLKFHVKQYFLLNGFINSPTAKK